ncbi:uncharacterized protein [Amphiura filiformis]|uniref:uncharacterized protein n=1 Tax=Amphiura filiformis TaxID=82378 RepID=UPI003B21200E
MEEYSFNGYTFLPTLFVFSYSDHYSSGQWPMLPCDGACFVSTRGRGCLPLAYTEEKCQEIASEDPNSDIQCCYDDGCNDYIHDWIDDINNFEVSLGAGIGHSTHNTAQAGLLEVVYLEVCLVLVGLEQAVLGGLVPGGTGGPGAGGTGWPGAGGTGGPGAGGTGGPGAGGTGGPGAGGTDGPGVGGDDYPFWWSSTYGYDDYTVQASFCEILEENGYNGGFYQPCDGTCYMIPGTQEQGCLEGVYDLETCEEHQGPDGDQFLQCCNTSLCNDAGTYTNSTNTCTEDEFSCDDGLRCIPESDRCDKIPNCNDHTDEINDCSCDSSDEFRCVSGECIAKSWYCDRFVDCLDSSDESNDHCDYQLWGESSWSSSSPSSVYPYPSYFSSYDYCLEGFICYDGLVCVKGSWRCDGIKDCNDGSDELDCDTITNSYSFSFSSNNVWWGFWSSLSSSSVSSSSSSYSSSDNCQDGFQCDDGLECIPGSWRCDDDTNCADGSDEENCDNAGDTGHGVRVCHEDEFGCITYLRAEYDCVPKTWLCDGEADCTDHRDEINNCTCDLTYNFQCGSGECIDNYFVCNHVNDCLDNSDETNDDCRTGITPTTATATTNPPPVNPNLCTLLGICDTRSGPVSGDNPPVDVPHVNPPIYDTPPVDGPIYDTPPFDGPIADTPGLPPFDAPIARSRPDGTSDTERQCYVCQDSEVYVPPVAIPSYPGSLYSSYGWSSSDPVIPIKGKRGAERDGADTLPPCSENTLSSCDGECVFIKGILDGHKEQSLLTQRQCSTNLEKENPKFSCDDVVSTPEFQILNAFCCSDDLCNWEEAIQEPPQLTQCFACQDTVEYVPETDYYDSIGRSSYSSSYSNSDSDDIKKVGKRQAGNNLPSCAEDTVVMCDAECVFAKGILQGPKGQVLLTQRHCSSYLQQVEPLFSCDNIPETPGFQILNNYCCSDDLCNWEEAEPEPPQLTQCFACQDTVEYVPEADNYDSNGGSSYSSYSSSYSSSDSDDVRKVGKRQAENILPSCAEDTVVMCETECVFIKGVLQVRQGPVSQVLLTQRHCASYYQEVDPSFSCDSIPEAPGFQMLDNYCCTDDLCNWNEPQDEPETLQCYVCQDTHLLPIAESSVTSEYGWSFTSWFDWFGKKRKRAVDTPLPPCSEDTVESCDGECVFIKAMIDDTLGRTTFTQLQCSSNIEDVWTDFTCESIADNDGVEILDQFCCADDLCNWKEDDDEPETLQCYVCQDVNTHLLPDAMSASPIAQSSVTSEYGWSYSSWISWGGKKRKRSVDTPLPPCSEDTVESCAGECVFIKAMIDDTLGRATVTQHQCSSNIEEVLPDFNCESIADNDGVEILDNFCCGDDLCNWREEDDKPDNPGECPPTEGEGGIGICANLCDDDSVCDATQKCCPTACGGSSCMEAIQIPDADNPGECPPTEGEGGIGICANLCDDDSVCDATQKCCPTACGGSSCMEAIQIPVESNQCYVCQMDKDLGDTWEDLDDIVIGQPSQQGPQGPINSDEILGGYSYSSGHLYADWVRRKRNVDTSLPYCTKDAVDVCSGKCVFRQAIVNDGARYVQVTQAQCLPTLLAEEPGFECTNPQVTDGLKSYCCSGDFCNWEEEDMAPTQAHPTPTSKLGTVTDKPVKGKPPNLPNRSGGVHLAPFTLMILVSLAFVFSIPK